MVVSFCNSPSKFLLEPSCLTFMCLRGERCFAKSLRGDLLPEQVFKHHEIQTEQGWRTGRKSWGRGAEIFADHYSMPWALAHGHLGRSGGMLPQKILEI